MCLKKIFKYSCKDVERGFEGVKIKNYILVMPRLQAVVRPLATQKLAKIGQTQVGHSHFRLFFFCFKFVKTSTSLQQTASQTILLKLDSCQVAHTDCSL